MFEVDRMQIVGGMRFAAFVGLLGWGSLGVAVLLGVWAFFEQREAMLRQQS
jgi:hypothetical protein